MKIKIFLTFLIFTFCGLATAGCANATIPSLSVHATSSGDGVQINVTGDANSSVLLFYTNNAFTYLGTTNSNGSFSTTISSGTYSITVNSQVYIRTGGIAGEKSNIVSWPYVQSSSNNSSTTLTLSQNAVLLNAGQTSTVTAGISYLYLKTNTNPSIANINLNAGQITVSALAYGSTKATLCAVGSTSNCADLSIVVQSSGTQQLTFSQNNFSIYSGQTTSVNVGGGSSGSYIISNNSNVNCVQATINGSVINLYATNTSGASSITVCTSDMNHCGILNVNSTAINSTAVTFSQTNPFVPTGQNTTVTIYGGAGTNFYVSSNSNPSVVQANISGNILTLIPNTSTGNSTISICAYAGSCASITANISTATGNSNAISLSQSSITILPGQSVNITISGGSIPYSISSPNSANIFSSNINGNTLTIYGVNAGSVTASICASVGCTDLSITVNSVNSTVNAPSFSQNNISLNVNQQANIYISGNGGYYVANNSSSNVASFSISGNSLIITALYQGSTNISVCQSGGQCSLLYVTVSNPTQTNNTTPIYQENYFSLIRYLGPGDDGDDVLQLQNALGKLGLLSANPNGYYGPATTLAVKSFQKQYGIKQTGSVGPSTKKALEDAKIVLSSSNNSTLNEQKISTIQATIAALLAQIKAMQGN